FDVDDLCPENHSTGLPRYTPISTSSYAPPPSGFPTEFVSPWQLHSASTSSSPNAIGSTAGPIDHSSAFPLLQIKPQRQYIDTSRRESTWIASADVLANGVDPVSAAFLQFLESVELEGRSRLNKSAPDLLRILLSNGCLAPNDLLAVVDWERLRNLAEKSVSRAFTPLVHDSSPWGDLQLDELSNSPNPNGISDFGETGDSDRGVDFLPLSISGSASSTAQSQTLPQPAEAPIEPTFCAFDEHRPVTPHAGAIVDAAGGKKRQCLNCGVDQTTQWRRHPESPGFLCNACGQHQLKHRTPRSKAVIMRGRAKANHKHAGTVPNHRSSLPEKRGGDVIMRISPKLAEHD
ncbi:hypothetical protein C8R45DRAFT_988944, partial [Mycena sanguinolenta]